MGLFGNKEEKEAEKAAAKAEAQRLVALPVPELAVEVMQAFGPDGPGHDGRQTGTLQIGIFLMRDHPKGNGQMKLLVEPIREALLRLQNVELVNNNVRSTGGGFVESTRLGQESLADGSYAKRITA